MNPISDRSSHQTHVRIARPERVGLVVQADSPQDLAEITQDLLKRDPGNRIKANLPLIGAVAIEVAPDQAVEVLAGRGVKVFPDAPVRLIEPFEGEANAQMDAAGPTLGAPELWKRGIDGKGVTVAVIDTGVGPHPDLQGRIVGFQDFVNGRTDPYDDQGHGSHVSGTVGGDGAASFGKLKGVAPEASIVGVKVLDAGGSGTFADVIAGIQWCVENKDRYGIKVLNLSLGAYVEETWKDDPVVQAVQAAERAGILPVIAAGNSGPFSGTVGTPGNAPAALTLGALDDRGTPWHWDDGIPFFSSRGPTPVDNLAKPDVVAPGAGITAAVGEGYKRMSGTSMASPMAAGVAALLMQAHPEATPAQVKQALMETADPLRGFSKKGQGEGAIDAPAALARLGELVGQGS